MVLCSTLVNAQSDYKMQARNAPIHKPFVATSAALTQQYVHVKGALKIELH